MSLEDSLKGLKYAVNSTIGDENNFKPLDKIIDEKAVDKTYIADKITLDSLVSTIGQTGDAGGVQLLAR